MEAIRVIQKSDNDNFIPIIEPQFVVLGMIDEYLGRRAVEHGSIVERFYPHERPLADLFAKYLILCGTSLHIDSAEVSVVQTETGHSHVESKRMNAYINALYKFEFEMDRFITLPDGLQQRIADVVLTIEEFPRKGSALTPNAHGSGPIIARWCGPTPCAGLCECTTVALVGYPQPVRHEQQTHPPELPLTHRRPPEGGLRERKATGLSGDVRRISSWLQPCRRVDRARDRIVGCAVRAH